MWDFINVYSLNGPDFDFIGSFFHTSYLLNSAFVGSTSGLVWRFLQIVLATIFVVLLSYYLIKMMAIARGRRGRNSHNLSVVESIAVGQQSMVQLVRAGDKYLVVGVTKERVTLLSELDKAEVHEPKPISFNSADVPFGNVLSRFLSPKDDLDDLNNDDRGDDWRSNDSASQVEADREQDEQR